MNKKTLIESLLGPDSGVKIRDSDFEEKVRHHIYLLLGVDEGQCSVTTKKSVASEAMDFRKRVRHFWQKKAANKAKLLAEPYFLQDIQIEVLPLSEDIPELAGPSTSGAHHSGAYKPFPEKGPRAQSIDIAAVINQHEPEAILRAAPRAASTLGLGTFATAIRKIAKDPEVNSKLALDGIKNKSMYYI